ncbi:MAG TPA: hypothetical protein VGE98_01755, partial [Thermoanaerobaculia bacterium]
MKPMPLAPAVERPLRRALGRARRLRFAQSIGILGLVIAVGVLSIGVALDGGWLVNGWIVVAIFSLLFLGGG